MKEGHLSALVAIRDLSEVLDASAGSVNVIVQFVESYVAKMSAIHNRLVSDEHARIGLFASDLRHNAQLSSEDAAKVVIAWMEEDAVKKVNGGAFAARMFESAIGAVRVLVTDSSLLGLLRGKAPVPTAAPTTPTPDAPKGN